MATYKVPQDVEADDKLIGPFSFRQFIYLIIVALAMLLAWGLAQLFIALAIIPLPIIVFFGALALPLRKDQPMEIYMAAMVSFYLKPRFRKWDPEGVETLINISAPKVVEVRRTKDLSQSEAEQRLSYLADIVDSQGWAIRGVSGAGTAMNNDVYLEAQSAEDVLDTNTSIAHNFDQMMQQSTNRAREEAKQRMMQASQPQPQPVAVVPAMPSQIPGGVVTDTTTVPEFNPYPNFHQSVIQPLGNEAYHAETAASEPHTQPTTQPQAAPTPTIAPAPAAQATPSAAQLQMQQAAAQAVQAAYQPKPEEIEDTPSDTALTAGIMNLANNPDLSIETIAHEAKRLKKKAEQESDEVVISLR